MTGNRGSSQSTRRNWGGVLLRSYISTGHCWAVPSGSAPRRLLDWGMGHPGGFLEVRPPPAPCATGRSASSSLTGPSWSHLRGHLVHKPLRLPQLFQSCPQKNIANLSWWSFDNVSYQSCLSYLNSDYHHHLSRSSPVPCYPGQTVVPNVSAAPLTLEC